jgi:uncharacterized metal-binding protein YceD (DUF177 family)
MRYRLHKLIGGPVGNTHIEQLDRGSTTFDDDLQVNYLRGTLTFTRLNRAIMVSSDLETEVTVQDARTLEAFGLCLRVGLDEVLFNLPDEFDPATDEPDRQISDDGWIDLTEAIREEIIMAIPINPINPAGAGAEGADVNEVIQENDDWLSVKWNNRHEGK